MGSDFRNFNLNVRCDVTIFKYFVWVEVYEWWEQFIEIMLPVASASSGYTISYSVNINNLLFVAA